MPSPSPGMNPNFEQAAHWLDFHTELLSASRRLLAPQVGPKYIVQLEEHIYIHDLPPEPRQRLGTAVDLQEALHRAYDGPGYEHFIYNGEPEPGLSATDAAWARQFVPAGT